MSCADWEIEIARESEAGELRDHLKECDGCRRFAAELAANRNALQRLPVDAATLTLVRNRVMAELTATRPRGMGWIWTAAAAAGLAALAASLSLFRYANPAPPRPIIFAKTIFAKTPSLVHPAPAQPVAEHRQVTRHRHAPLVAGEPLVIKMLTNDPNVIIIWIADEKGDSL